MRAAVCTAALQFCALGLPPLWAAYLHAPGAKRPGEGHEHAST